MFAIALLFDGAPFAVFPVDWDENAASWTGLLFWWKPGLFASNFAPSYSADKVASFGLESLGYAAYDKAGFHKLRVYVVAMC